MVHDGGVFDTCNPGDKVCLAAISAYYLGKRADADKQLEQIRNRNFAEAEYMLNRAIALGEERERMLNQANALGEKMRRRQASQDTPET